MSQVRCGSKPAGVKIPRVKGDTLGTYSLPLEEGLRRYKAVLQRLKTEPPTLPSPIFGKMTHEESIALTLRHAELHLGFLCRRKRGPRLGVQGQPRSGARW